MNEKVISAIEMYILIIALAIEVDRAVESLAIIDLIRPFLMFCPYYLLNLCCFALVVASVPVCLAFAWYLR